MKKVEFWVRAGIKDDHERLGLSAGQRIKIQHNGYEFASPHFGYGPLVVARRIRIDDGMYRVEHDWCVFNPASGGALIQSFCPTRNEAIARVNKRLKNKPYTASNYMKGIALLHSAIEWKPPQ